MELCFVCSIRVRTGGAVRTDRQTSETRATCLRAFIWEERIEDIQDNVCSALGDNFLEDILDDCLDEEVYNEITGTGGRIGC